MRHEFVEFIPCELEEGVLYISIPYTTAVHNCCCGCGNRVVTPLTPADWKLSYDGEAVWLSPSIGNWNFPCQSHYWPWLKVWSKSRICQMATLVGIPESRWQGVSGILVG